MNRDVEIILNYLREKRGVDFFGYRPSMIERRLRQRLNVTGSADFQDYLKCLHEYPEELDHLADALSINVSSFFRDTLTMEYVSEKVLPELFLLKSTSGDPSLRIWSAGCATGEEAYTIAILINELLRKEAPDLQVHLFATDIDAGALKRASEAGYTYDSIKNVKYRLLKRYFLRDGKRFRLRPEISRWVTFSKYDLLDTKTVVPPESVYGSFDMVLCRNVLIYFSPEYQERVLHKLHRSLAEGGYLILGEAERLLGTYQRHYRRMNECCPVYRKEEHRTEAWNPTPEVTCPNSNAPGTHPISRKANSEK